ncbi:hypothetical protein BX661DRAFT_146877, partial [Kickxella alabastrina]|uniref:uncharacterized protein n=1 Tax=Kickxella alabastrina TaxID=61397 RepID=UPI00221E741E
MRESNFHFPSTNKACVSITSALYDRRALDCTADLPLVNSLSHLNYLTSSSARIREILTTDGGLERLVRILRTTRVTEDTLHNWKWTMAFQCVVNVGVRGTTDIRQRVVQVGAVPILVEILHAYSDVTAQGAHVAIPGTHMPYNSNAYLYSEQERLQAEYDAARRRLQAINHVMYRHDDVVLTLQLLAYLTKTPSQRQLLHECPLLSAHIRIPSGTDVERFTVQRAFPSDMVYWSAIVMRNSCRRDEARNNCRQCAYLKCQKWEVRQNEFAKCRRCRKAKYCSKSCQSKAWQEGHRNWCSERN